MYKLEFQLSQERQRFHDLEKDQEDLLICLAEHENQLSTFRKRLEIPDRPGSQKDKDNDLL
jgi:hypothetical protein